MPHYHADTTPDFALPKIKLGSSGAERYQVRAKGQIGRLFKQMHSAGVLVTAYYGPDERYLLCSLLAAEPENKRLILSSTSDAETTHQLARAQQLICVSRHHDVRIQWQSETLKTVDYQGEPALLTPMPQSLLHLQRREFHRLTTPVTHPARCRIKRETGPHPEAASPATPSPVTTPPASPPDNVEVTLVDISCGGIGILDAQHELDLQPGMIYRNCILILNELGEFTVDIEIRNTYPITLINGKPAQRTGCAFLNLPSHIDAALQRYLHALDMKRHGHLGDSVHG